MKYQIQKLYKYVFIFLFILLYLVLTGKTASSYETCIITFPYGTWKSILYKKTNKESLVQFILDKESKNNYTETVIFHGYKNKSLDANNLLIFLFNRVKKYNDNIKYVTLKVANDDSMMYWCGKNIITNIEQCEIVRTSKSYEGIISMHYIVYNYNRFNNVYKYWIDTIKNVKIYYSYFRWDRMMNKATTFEL